MQDHDVVAIPLSKINPEEPLCTDIFLLIADKYIKYKEKGDCITPEKYDLFLSKNVSHIYVTLEGRDEFAAWVDENRSKSIDEVTEQVGEENRHLAEKREDIKEKIYETYAEQELDSGAVELLQDNVSEFIEEASKKKVSSAVLAQLRKRSDTLADHAVNTANVAVYLAMALGHGHQFVLENVYMGALFHDYGKAKIPAKLLENPNGSLYSQALQDHPLKGAKAVKKIEAVPEQVATIVAQHHEQFNGGGYPKGLKGDDIYELAKIVSIANIFDNFCVENKNRSEIEKYRTAIKAIEYDRGKQFDPALMDRVIDALKLAYGNYHR